MKCQCETYLLLDWQYCPVCTAPVLITDQSDELKSRGFHRFPAAFAPLSYRFGKHVADQSWFYATFCQYVLLIKFDPTQLVYFRSTLLDRYFCFVGPNPPVATNEAFWCAISLVTDRYFRRRAAIYSWSSSQEQQIVEAWYDLIDLAFLVHEKNTVLETSKIAEWSSRLDEMQTQETGPHLACQLCESKCKYGEDIKFMITNDPLAIGEARSSVEGKSDSQQIEQLAWFARLWTERTLCLYDEDFAFCMSINVADRLGWSPERVHQLMVPIRESCHIDSCPEV
ncbi:MAG: hypothetical protein K2X77_28035 [Candidatus Obscuribacterales bacterium]|jgi:hypothetical protein|nr:hypothetical protein [Candidatus Obscuribacterales bacterium]